MERPTTIRVSLARKLAREVLRANDIVFPPVDARALVGARARVVLFDDDTEDGMTVWDERRGKCYVYINRQRLNGRRANFTWAHEAGHIYLEHGRLYDCNNLTEYERRILDREADLFAVELLMPRAWMEKFVAVPCGSAGLEQVGKLFGASEPALVRRLAELGLQGYDETEAIQREEAAERLTSRKTVLYSHRARVLEWALQAAAEEAARRKRRGRRRVDAGAPTEGTVAKEGTGAHGGVPRCEQGGVGD